MKALLITLTTIGISVCITGIVYVDSLKPIPHKAKYRIEGVEFVRFSLAHK